MSSLGVRGDPRREQAVLSASVPFVSAADGARIAVHDLGGRGAPIVLAHAAGLHGLVFAPLAAHLGGTYHCYSVDHRCHGDSSLPEGGSLDWYGLAADVLAGADGLAPDRVIGFGHSSGATALLMAEQSRPGTFRAIYCFEPVLIGAEPAAAIERGTFLATSARRRRSNFASRDEALRHYSSKPPLSSFAPDALRAYVDHGFEDTAGGDVRLKCRPDDEATVYETASSHDAVTRLGDVACPVLIASGAQTDAVSADQARALAALLPLGRCEEVAGVGHFGPLEDPETLAASTLRFLTEVAPP